MKNISVIIPTHIHEGRKRNLTLLLKTLLVESNLSYIKEVLIIDNGCTLDKSILDNKGPNSVIQIIKEPLIGLNNARNCGVRQANGTILAFLDDDVTVSDKWAKALQDGYISKDILCVGGPVTLNDIDLTVPSWFTNYFKRFLFPPEFPKDSGLLKPPFYLIGANMSFNKDSFKEFGLFDPDLDRKGSNLLSNGDTDFIARLPKNSVWYSKDAYVSVIEKMNRFTRFYMIKRLYWQGISDYKMIRNNGSDNFYDKNEIFINRNFFKLFMSKLINLKLFECFCMLVRIYGFYIGSQFIKEKRG